MDRSLHFNGVPFTVNCETKETWQYSFCLVGLNFIERVYHVSVWCK